MAIKDPLMFITIQEFKSWNGFNKLEFDEITTPDSEIFKAISIASNNIDYLSGFTISKKWPEITITDFTDEIQTATAYYVNFLLTKDVNYLRGQASISQGGITYSENNPDDPYFIVPEVFSCLRKIKHYLTFKGFPLNVSPRKSNTFFGNGGNENILEEYVKINLLKSSDPRVEIKKIHQKNINGVIIDFDTTGIKTDINNSLWEVNKDNPNFIVPKDDKGIDVNGKRIIDVGTPTFLSDATTKEYVDNKIPDLTNYYKKQETNDLLIKKQDKLIAGENIKIENNVISTTGGGLDPTKYYIKPEVDKKLEDVKSQFPIAFQINAVSQEIPNLETTNKTVAGAINEIKDKQSSQNIPQWKKVADVFCKDNKDWITYNCLPDKKYKIWYNISPTNCTPSSEHTFMSQEFVYSYNQKVPSIVVIASLDNKSLKLQKGNPDKFGWDNNSYGNLWKLEELQE